MKNTTKILTLFPVIFLIAVGFSISESYADNIVNTSDSYVMHSVQATYVYPDTLKVKITNNLPTSNVIYWELRDPDNVLKTWAFRTIDPHTTYISEHKFKKSYKEGTWTVGSTDSTWQSLYDQFELVKPSYVVEMKNDIYYAGETPQLQITNISGPVGFLILVTNEEGEPHQQYATFVQVGKDKVIPLEMDTEPWMDEGVYFVHVWNTIELQSTLFIYMN